MAYKAVCSGIINYLLVIIVAEDNFVPFSIYIAFQANNTISDKGIHEGWSKI